MLWRRPGVLATVAGACAVVAASLAGVPLFLSSVGTATVAVQAAERCPRDTGASRHLGVTAGQVRSPSPDPFLPVADRLGPTSSSVRIERIPLAPVAGGRDVDTALLARDGALQHVEVLEGAAGPGVWLPDRAAERTGLAVGDQARIGAVALPVAGIYRDVAGTTVDDYWCADGDLVLLRVLNGDLVLPPPVVIVDRATFATVMDGSDISQAEGIWQAPMRPGLTVDEVEGLVPALACRTATVPALAWCVDGQPPVAGVNRRSPRQGVVEARDDDDFVRRFLHSSLPFVGRRARAVETSVGSGIWPMAALAAVAGVGLVAAAASLWFDRRRREVTLLTVRGVSPAALGLKAVLELWAALLVGSLVGIGTAWLAVRGLGPSTTVEPAARDRALQAGAVALLGAAATVGGVVAWRARSHGERRLRRLRWSVVPWELGLGAVALVSYRRLGDWGVPVGRGADVSRVDALGLLFPVLFLLTSVAVLARAVGLALGPLRALSRSWPIAVRLGVARVARHRAAVVGLVGASAVAAGVLGYATTLNRSLEATLDLKASTFVGSDVAVRIPTDATLPPDLARRATTVRVHQDAWAMVGHRESISVLVVDPATFGRGAAWDDDLSPHPWPQILGELSRPSTEGLVPALVVGMDLAGPAPVGIVGTGTTRFTIEPRSDAEAFPGMSKPDPTVVITAEAAAALEIDGGRTETWIRGDHDEVLAALERAGTPFEETRRAVDVADSASFLTVSWTFGFMQSLGLSAGLLALGGAAVYLDARRRARLLGYAFMRRMGLTRAQHRRAVLVEVAASLLTGCWVGLGIALGAAQLAHEHIDPVPGFRPDPVLRPAVSVLLGFAVGSVALVLVASRLAQRRVDRDDPVEVLRAGT